MSNAFTSSLETCVGLIHHWAKWKTLKLIFVASLQSTRDSWVRAKRCVRLGWHVFTPAVNVISLGSTFNIGLIVSRMQLMGTTRTAIKTFCVKIKNHWFDIFFVNLLCMHVDLFEFLKFVYLQSKIVWQVFGISFRNFRFLMNSNFVFDWHWWVLCRMNALLVSQIISFVSMMSYTTTAAMSLKANVSRVQTSPVVSSALLYWHEITLTCSFSVTFMNFLFWIFSNFVFDLAF